MATARGGRTTPKKPARVDVGIDPGKLTVGDLEDLEEAFGLTLDSLVEMVEGQAIGKMNAKTIAGLVFVLKRQTDPDFKPEDARKVTMNELYELSGATNDPAVQRTNQPVRLAGTGKAVRKDPTAGG